MQHIPFSCTEMLLSSALNLSHTLVRLQVMILVFYETGRKTSLYLYFLHKHPRIGILHRFVKFYRHLPCLPWLFITFKATHISASLSICISVYVYHIDSVWEINLILFSHQNWMIRLIWKGPLISFKKVLAPACKSRNLLKTFCSVQQLKLISQRLHQTFKLNIQIGDPPQISVFWCYGYLIYIYIYK